MVKGAFFRHGTSLVVRYCKSTNIAVEPLEEILVTDISFRMLKRLNGYFFTTIFIVVTSRLIFDDKTKRGCVDITMQH